MNELYERKEAALRSLEVWFAAEREREVLRVLPERVRTVERRGPPRSKFGVYADSPEYAKRYQRERRAKMRKLTGRDR